LRSTSFRVVSISSTRCKGKWDREEARRLRWLADRHTLRIDDEVLDFEESGAAGEFASTRVGGLLMALYTYVRGKDDLIDGLIDQVYADLDLAPDTRGDWTEQLAALSQADRAHLLAHPAVVPLALQQPGLGPNGLRLGEAIYSVLRPAGFSDQVVVGTVYALLTYILGFVALEVPRAGTYLQTSDEFVRRLLAYFSALPPEEFSHHVELAPLLARFSTDDQFQFGIRTFLAGLQAQGPAPKRPR